MTSAESILASRLLDQAAVEFHEHSCNDMDPEYFEGLTDTDIAELLDGYNAWHRGETGETCGDPTDDYIGMAHIGDDMWMAYLAAVIGRKMAEKPTSCNDCGLPTGSEGDELCGRCYAEELARAEWELMHPELRCPPRE